MHNVITLQLNGTLVYGFVFPSHVIVCSAQTPVETNTFTVQEFKVCTQEAADEAEWKQLWGTAAVLLKVHRKELPLL